MALRGTLTHWKTRLLASGLGIEPWAAMGLLEALWHVTAELAPSGNIGRLPNKAIAMEMFYEGDPDALVAALTDSGHLDQDSRHRLVVHDWSQHADYNTRRKLERRGLAMADNGRHVSVVTRHESIPAPVPEPVPDPAPEPDPVKEHALPISAAEVDRIYAAYPRKIGRAAAIVKIRVAIAHLGSGKDMPKLKPPEALEFLLRQVQAYARSPAGNQGEFTPHPATWFHQARYLDDESEWQHAGNQGHNTGNRAQQRVSGNLDALARADAADGEPEAPDRAGGGSAGVGIGGDAGRVREGPGAVPPGGREQGGRHVVLEGTT